MVLMMCVEEVMYGASIVFCYCANDNPHLYVRRQIL